MKRLAGLLLLFLLVSAQVDETWAAAPFSPSAPPADDDEYLPSPQRPQGPECSPSQEWVLAGLGPQAADLPVVRSGVLLGRGLTAPFAPPPLYVLMSLQI
jgi:hypothetical protein